MLTLLKIFSVSFVASAARELDTAITPPVITFLYKLSVNSLLSAVSAPIIFGIVDVL